jgi:hypothetical protein
MKVGESRDKKEKTWNKGETTGPRRSIKQDTMATMKKTRSNKGAGSITLPLTQRKGHDWTVGETMKHPLKRNSFEFCIISADYEMASICYAF